VCECVYVVFVYVCVCACVCVCVCGGGMNVFVCGSGSVRAGWDTDVVGANSLIAMLNMEVEILVFIVFKGSPFLLPGVRQWGKENG
jgi:hypothetical protein